MCIRDRQLIPVFFGTIVQLFTKETGFIVPTEEKFSFSSSLYEEVKWKVQDHCVVKPIVVKDEDANTVLIRHFIL